VVEETMQDRRESVRDKVFLSGVAEISQAGSKMDCVVRNFSDTGACVEFDSARPIPEQVNLTISRKGRSYLAQMIWREANRVGLSFLSMITSDSPESDLDARLRRSEKKKRQLQRRINQLLGD
jgi:hypothetical protein